MLVRTGAPAWTVPRATLSVLHKPRFGRFKKDLEGLLDRLSAAS